VINEDIAGRKGKKEEKTENREQRTENREQSCCFYDEIADNNSLFPDP